MLLFPNSLNLVAFKTMQLIYVFFSRFYITKNLQLLDISVNRLATYNQVCQWTLTARISVRKATLDRCVVEGQPELSWDFASR